DPGCVIARQAAEAILAVYAQDFEVVRKDDDSPVTAADLAAQRVIAEGLHTLAPGVPVISEEALAAPWSERAQWTRYWLVDPLDGTREFVKRNGEFTVNIALIEDGVSRLGVVYAPACEVMAAGAAGLGTLIARGDEKPKVARVAPRRAGPLRIAGSRSHYAPRTNEFLERVGAHELISLGSSLKFCVL